MLASTVTASSRKAMASTRLGAAAVIGYPSSRLASSSALIAEISASTASTSVPVCTQRRTTCQRPGRTAAAPTGRPRREVDIGAMQFALRAPAASLAAPPCLLHQRPGQQLLRAAEPGPPADAAAPTTTAWTDSTDRSCVYSSHKIMPSSAMSISNSQCACHRGERGQTRHRQSILRRWLTTSVHACGTVIWPPTPPEHTNTVSPARRLR